MAHHMRIKKTPHINMDGSTSKTRSDYTVVDRNRGGKTVVGVESSQKRALEMIEEERARLRFSHVTTHPNDQAFLNKHGKRVQ